MCGDAIDRQSRSRKSRRRARSTIASGSATYRISSGVLPLNCRPVRGPSARAIRDQTPEDAGVNERRRRRCPQRREHVPIAAHRHALRATPDSSATSIARLCTQSASREKPRGAGRNEAWPRSANAALASLAPLARSRASARLRGRALSRLGIDVLRGAVRGVLRFARESRAVAAADVHLDVAEARFGTFLLFAASVVMVLGDARDGPRTLRAARAWTARAIVAAARVHRARAARVRAATRSRSRRTPTGRSTTR